MNELRFDGRSAIVTGAGRGLGRAHALLLASRGARVVVADLGGEVDGSGSSSSPADQVVKEIEAAGGEAVASYASVADEADAASIVETALEAFGCLDVVVNNAGISDPGPFDDLSLEQFRRMVAVHYLGTVSVIKAAWPHLRAAGYGRIVNTCSEGMLGLDMVSSYAGAKGGVYGLTSCLALEGAKYGILVNGIAPRAATRISDPEVLAYAHGLSIEDARNLIAPYAPELVSPAVAFLAHESCPFHGQFLAAGAGRVQRMAVVETQGITRDALSPEDIAENIETLMDMTNAQLKGVGAAVNL